MPNQNECDHTLGVIWVGENAISKLYRYEIRCVDHNKIAFKFDYCPKCGERIDWDKIKEEVNAD